MRPVVLPHRPDDSKQLRQRQGHGSHVRECHCTVLRVSRNQDVKNRFHRRCISWAAQAGCAIAHAGPPEDNTAPPRTISWALSASPVRVVPTTGRATRPLQARARQPPGAAHTSQSTARPSSTDGSAAVPASRDCVTREGEGCRTNGLIGAGTIKVSQ